MLRRSKQQRESLNSAVSKYHAALEGSPAGEFLEHRGFSLSSIERYRFGYVQDPLPEHAQYEGMLAIPYLRYHPRFGWGTVDIRFRVLDDSKPKYVSMHGAHPRLYNTPELLRGGFEVGIAEGEIDAVTATECGLPTVGVPGSQSWKPHWTPLFRGYSRVWILGDGDDAGRSMVSKVADLLPNAQVVILPEGEDINSVFQKEGKQGVQRLWTPQENTR